MLILKKRLYHHIEIFFVTCSTSHFVHMRASKNGLRRGRKYKRGAVGCMKYMRDSKQTHISEVFRSGSYSQMAQLCKFVFIMGDVVTTRRASLMLR